MDNQRVRLTKRLLSESLLDLMQQKDLDQISVIELCRKAGINRATFYRYYSNPVDVLQEIQSETCSSYAHFQHNEAEAVETLTAVLQKTHENINRARIFNDMTTDSIFKGNCPETSNDVYFKLLAGTVPEEMREYARFMTSAAMTVWLRNECDLDERKFSAFLLNVCKLCKEST